MDGFKDTGGHWILEAQLQYSVPCLKIFQQNSLFFSSTNTFLMFLLVSHRNVFVYAMFWKYLHCSRYFDFCSYDCIFARMRISTVQLIPLKLWQLPKIHSPSFYRSFHRFLHVVFSVSIESICYQFERLIYSDILKRTVVKSEYRSLLRQLTQNFRSSKHNEFYG